MKYLKYHIGRKDLTSHIDAVHAHNPRADEYTGAIVKGVIKKINASGIISTISRTEMDINRPRNETNAPAIDEFREAIKNIIFSKRIINTKDNSLTKQYLHLAIHGMRDDRETDFEIGTLGGNSCSQDISDLFISRLSNLTKKIGINSIFPGDSSKSVHRTGEKESEYIGYGANFHTIQIEINRTWRKNKREELIQFFSEIIIEFDKVFNEK